MADTVLIDELAGEETSDFGAKKAQVTNRLQQRETDRLAHVEKRRWEKESVSAKDESVQFFQSRFDQAKSDIQQGLLCEGVSKDKLIEHFDNLSVLLQKLQKFFSDSTYFLTSHDVSKSQETLNQLQLAIQEKREEYMPKKKFAFRGKKKAAAVASTTTSNATKAKSAAKEVTVSLNECNFSDQSSKELSKPREEINNKDVALARLDNCTVKLFGSPSALIVDKLTKCTVLCGPVSGSVFVDNCVDCTFVVGCQQMRIHHTTSSHFYLHVTSRAIIEDCNQVQFAPYTLNYSGLQGDFELSGLNQKSNNWDDIDDFNWLASDRHSPNWSLLPESDRKSTWED